MRALIAIVIAGCSVQEYAYIPQGAPRDELVVEVPVPEVSGTMTLSSSGIVELASTQMLHVRMRVTNDRAPSWTFDTGAQRVAFGKQFPARALLVDSAPRYDILTVRRGESRAFDFYFELLDSKEPERFVLVWQVDTGAGPIFLQTAFTREDIWRNRK